MAVRLVIMERNLAMLNILDVRTKFITRRVERMMIQAQTGRKAATRPRQTAL